MSKIFPLLGLLICPLTAISQSLYVPGGTVGASSTANIGIGTSSPQSRVQVEGSGDYDAILRLTNTGVNGGDWSIISTNATWTAGARSLLFTTGLPRSVNYKFIISDSGKVGIGSYNVSGNDKLFVTGGATIDKLGVGVKSPASSKVQIEGSGTYDAALRLTNTGSGGGDWSMISSNSSWPAGSQSLIFCYGAPSSANSKVVFTNTGKVGIGTYDFAGDYRLYVAGNILSEGLVVKLQSQWPDYVFNKNYRLTSLDSIASFIEKNHHLPLLPSSKNVSAQGVDVGKMDVKLVRQIEELTLHLIRQNKLIERQNEAMHDQDAKLRALRLLVYHQQAQLNAIQAKLRAQNQDKGDK